MTRVLLVSPSAKAGGAERAFAALARRLPAHGFEPLAALLEPGPLQGWLADAGCEAALAPGRDALGWLRRSIRRTRARLVVSSKWEGHVVAGVAAAAGSIPAVWWQHDVARPSPGQFRAASIPAAVVVCVSDYAVREQRRLTPDVRVVRVYAGVSVTDVAARSGSGRTVREALGWTGVPLVGIVGRLDRWKGQTTFLHSAREVGARWPAARFAMVGGAVLGTEGAYPAELEQLAGELGLADRVHFAGHQADAVPWLDALDVVVHASTAEPFGLVVVEAMALGKPVVATRPGGPAEIVEDGKSGLLVPAGEPRPMAAAVLRLLEARDLAARLGAAARERAACFSDERMTREFAAVLESLLA